MKKLVWLLLIMFLLLLYCIISVIFSLPRVPEALDYLVVYFWGATFFVYLIQIAIIIVGLIFHFVKEKQTIKNLLVPYGFIFTLKNYYKELK